MTFPILDLTYPLHVVTGIVCLEEEAITFVRPGALANHDGIRERCKFFYPRLSSGHTARYANPAIQMKKNLPSQMQGGRVFPAFTLQRHMPLN